MPRKRFNAAERANAIQAMNAATNSIATAQTTVNQIPATPPGNTYLMADDAVVDLVEAKSSIDAALADLGGRPCGGGKPC